MQELFEISVCMRSVLSAACFGIAIWTSFCHEVPGLIHLFLEILHPPTLLGICGVVLLLKFRRKAHGGLPV